ncbi:hypothetical protein EJD97_014066 [Solanum chilense]|uniref:Uncharacterized protein n=1 Tax=Solanum chilense TaxID=4083 RepID=A0A6N2BCQ8_SOLCI|nr:hypothetical protein EJD97_014066 [Solanum chilense]
MTYEKIRAAFLTLARAMMDQANTYVWLRMNASESTIASRLRDIVRMNLPIFFGSGVGEYPQEYLDGVHKIVFVIGVSSREKLELASYQLREVAQVWFTQSRDNRPVKAGSIE